MENNEGKIEELFREGLNKKKSEKYLESIDDFNKVLEIVPDDDLVIIEIGDSYEMLGETEKALDYYDKVLNKKKDHPLAMAKKGYILQYFGEIEEGRKLCSEAVKLSPDSELVLATAGEYFISHDKKEAKRLFEKTLKINPECPKALFYMGQICDEENKISGAKDFYEKAARVDVKYKNMLYSYVETLHFNEIYDDALMFLERYLSFDVDNLRFHYLKGKILMSGERWEEALESFSTAYKINYRDSSTLFNMGSIYYRLGNVDDAMDCYNKVLEIEPKHAETLANIAAIYCDFYQEYSKALEYVEMALEADEKLINGYVFRGIIFSHTGEVEKSMNSYDQALEIDPENCFALLRKGGLLNDALKLHDEAIKCFNKALEIEPDNVEGWWNLSQAHVGKNDYNAAIEYLNSLLAIDPTHIDALFNKGVLLSRQGKNTAAKNVMAQILELEPNNVKALHALSAISETDTEGISGDVSRMIQFLAEINPQVKKYLEGIAESSDQILATVLVNQLRKFVSEQTEAGSARNMSEMNQIFANADIKQMVTWLAEKGAKQILSRM